MNIGLTYDLKTHYLAQGYSPQDVAEMDNPDTIQAIESALTSQGHHVDHIGNLKTLVNRLSQNHSWDLVFNIAEGLHGSAREAQIPGLLEAYKIPTTFADSLTLALCLDKALTKHVARGLGIPTPNFTTITPQTLSSIPNLNLNYPTFAKPLAEGSGLGVSSKGKADNPSQLTTICTELLTTHKQPVLVEEFLPGREFTVGITGTGSDAKILGVMEVHLLHNAEPDVYSYENKNKYEDRITYKLTDPDDEEANQAADIALKSYRALGCRDAGRADIRSDKNNQPQFMEINPLAGLNPTHSDLPILCRLKGIDYIQLIADIVSSAIKRI